MSQKATNAMTTDEIVEVCGLAKKIEFPSHTMELLYSKVKHRWKDLTKDMPRIGFVRDLLRFESPEIVSAPPWAKCRPCPAHARRWRPLPKPASRRWRCRIRGGG